MPQQKKTAPIDAAELPDLDPRDQEFVRLVITGKSASDAFRATRDCSNWQSSTVWAEASRLRNDRKVLTWIDAAKLAGMSSCAVTYQSHIDELERLKTIAVKTGNIGAAVQAEQIRGKAAGLHVEQIRDITPRELDPFDTLRNIARDLGDDIAKQAAAKAGIPWPLPARADQPAADTRH